MSPQNLTNVYNQNPTLQSSYTLQQYLDLFGGSSTTPPPTTIQPVPTPNVPEKGIINQNINQYQNQGGDGGETQGLDPYSRPQGNSLNSLTKTKFGYDNALGKTFTGLKDFGSSVVDKFSGLPGVEQGKGLIQNIMDNTMIGRLAAARNPLNPKASNYSPDLQGQIDFLDGMTGTGITGTSDNLKFTEGLAMIGRDPNSGLGKYGPGSVLSGQNVVSGFGTNSYTGQLQNYIDKMMSYATLSKFQTAKVNRAKAELKAAEEKAMLEEKAKEEAAKAAANAYDYEGRSNEYGTHYSTKTNKEAQANQDRGRGKSSNAGMSSSARGAAMHGADGGVVSLKDGGSTNGSGKAALSAKVKELMDDGYEFGEAVKEAMKQGYMNGGRIKSYFKGGLVSLRGK